MNMNLVVHTRYFFPQEKGKTIKKGYGAEWRIYELYKRLSKKHNVLLVTQHFDKENIEELDGIIIHRVPFFPKIKFLTRFFSIRRFFALFSQSVDADAIIAEFHPFHCVGLEALIVSKILKKPLVLDVHDISSNFIYEIYEKFIYRFSDLIIATSPEMKEYIKKFNKNVFVVENGVDTQLALESVCPLKRPKKRIIGFLGSLTPQHGVKYLISAFKGLELDAEIWIIGDGRERKNLEELAKRLGVSESIKFFGFLKKEKAYSLLSCCDVLVAPFPKGKEYTTNLPLKILDYLSLGKPMVVSDIPVLKRIAKDTGNLVAKAEDPKDLSLKIKEAILLDGKTKERLSKTNKKYVNNYSWDILSKKFDKILRDFLENKK